MKNLLSSALILAALLMSVANYFQPATFSATAITLTVIAAGIAVCYGLIRS